MKCLKQEQILLTIDDLTQKRVQELHGEKYKKGDLRTYRNQPLARTPAREIEIHEHMPVEKGAGSVAMSTSLGRILGTTHSTSSQQAANKVFHFPKATDFKDLILVKKVDITTSYPTWMIERYGIDNLGQSLSHTQATNIYLNKKTGHFLICFDESFLDGVALSDLVTTLSDEEAAMVSVISCKKGGDYLTISSDNLNDIQKSTGEFQSIKRAVMKAYMQLFITAQNTEKVICVSIKSGAVSSDRYYSRSRSVSSQLRKMVEDSGMSLDMSFLVAAKRESTLYPISEDGRIITSEPFVFERKHADSSATGLMGSGLSKCGKPIGSYWDENEWRDNVTLMLPYTDEDYEFLCSVVERLDQLKEDLISFFKQTESRQDGIDSSFDSALESYAGSSPLLINKV
ncbi:hypothetical protein [Vibrio crassostreae]|uniref:hypothetical protein n=1 Tax=Vibrio crassostreae TaxID=246167 RepID=UPI001B305C2E|nr:hypothetical protein [Vibrio crassostreae]